MIRSGILSSRPVAFKPNQYLKRAAKAVRLGLAIAMQGCAGELTFAKRLRVMAHPATITGNDAHQLLAIDYAVRAPQSEPQSIG